VPAKSNAELVESIFAYREGTLGMEIATPDDARKILGLHQQRCQS
jgi:uncharacterized protein (DUF849 family)